MDKKESATAGYHLQELGHSNYEVAKGEPDIRGWSVGDSQGNRLGKVRELLCDPEARKVRYLVVDLEGNVMDLEPRDVLIPIGLAELHGAEDVVTIPQVSATQLQALPAYQRDTLNHDVENQIQQVFSTGNAQERVSSPERNSSIEREPPQPTYYNQEQFNQANLYRNRRAKNVIGLFPDAASVDRATNELIRTGFSKEDIETAIRHTDGSLGGYSSSNFERYFYSLFAAPEEATHYQEKMQRSNGLVVVHAFSPEEANRAARILDLRHTSELDIQVEKTTSPTPDRTTPRESTTIPVIEERVQIGKQEVETGGARVHSHIVERPVEENMRLREERIQIERVPLDRPADQADFASFQEGSIELKEYAEVPVISKEAHVVEEITIGKDVEVHEETIYETVKKTEVQVEDLSRDTRQNNPPNSPNR